MARRGGTMTALSKVAAVALLLVWAPSVVCGFIFEVPSGVQKCFAEVVGEHALAVADWEVVDLPEGSDPYLNVVMTAPDGKQEYSRSNEPKAKFAFTANTEGIHSICFTNTGNQPRRVALSFKTGVEANDYSEVARKEHLKPLELELRKLEDQAREIYNEQAYQRKREERHRRTNESTNTRVVWFSILSIVVVVTLGLWQTLYLQRFFKARKMM